MYTGIRLLLHIRPIVSSFFFLSNFQTLKFLVTLFSGTVRPRRLKLGTNMDSGLMYHLYRNQASATYSSHYFFIFLSLQLSKIKIFVTFFSGTVRSRRLKLGQRWIVGRCITYTGIRLLLICPFISSFFFLSNFQTLKFFITLFSRTVRPRRLKLGTHMDSGQMYRVYRNQAAAHTCDIFLDSNREIWVYR